MGAKRGTKTATGSKKGQSASANQPLTKGMLEDSLKALVEHLDGRFLEERKRTDAQFSEAKERTDEQYRYVGGLLEDIRAQNRAVIEAVQGERQARQSDVRALRDDVYPRLEIIEMVVREHSVRLDTKADSSRVEALERAAR